MKHAAEARCHKVMVVMVVIGYGIWLVTLLALLRFTIFTNEWLFEELRRKRRRRRK